MARQQLPQRIPLPVLIAAPIVLLILIVAFQSYRVVPVGHVAVAQLFGKVQGTAYPEGFHFPVNPMYRWANYDIRHKTTKETADVPTRDQLQSTIDVSVQWRIIGSMASQILQETGDVEDVLTVHLIPKLRSSLRESGKAIARAEDLFLEDTQRLMQESLTTTLQEYLLPWGVEVQQVLIRDINMPAFINKAIESKKEREQEVEKQKAELERFTTEQEQVVVEAAANRQAAEEEAQTVRLLADARAYEITVLNEAIAQNPAYIQLQALQALEAISKDPASKLYFLNGDAPMPLPLMNIGQQ
ncbi:MAG: regulator of protease activity HflC (stomatin/prohibitin superfamily) [Planctomycetota bacterium]|jgi:regulator of protease activity HflC (stomatin/prohibitin superfamily)